MRGLRIAGLTLAVLTAGSIAAGAGPHVPVASVYKVQPASQPPIPGPTKAAQPVQQAAPTPNNDPASDQRGTQNAPLFINVIPSKDAEEVAADERNNRNQTTAINDSIRRYTLWLVIATAVLGVIGIAQSVFTSRQIKLARQEFISTNRPQIILREAYTTPDDGQPFQASMTLANTGGTTATIVACAFCIEYSLAEGIKRQVDDGEAIPAELTAPIAAGSHRKFVYRSAVTWPPQRQHYRLGDKGRSVIPVAGQHWAYFFFGRVSYKDDLGVIRNMAFYRSLDHASYRFVPVGDPQLEYSDERA